jgi:hypothetical protein
MEFMLSISSDNLPKTALCYLAFRVSFQETLERVALAKQIDDLDYEIFGYLTEVPFLQAVAPHVQLDLLAETWAKHSSDEEVEASLLDEGVVYAVCETAARIATHEPTVITHCLISGPQNAKVPVDTFLASELRNLHLSMSNEGDFLLISQFEDMHPAETRQLKKQFNMDFDKLDEMFDVLGRWSISPKFIQNLYGLLSEREQIGRAHV